MKADKEAVFDEGCDIKNIPGIIGIPGIQVFAVKMLDAQFAKPNSANFFSVGTPF